MKERIGFPELSAHTLEIESEKDIFVQALAVIRKERR